MVPGHQVKDGQDAQDRNALLFAEHCHPAEEHGEPETEPRGAVQVSDVVADGEEVEDAAEEIRPADDSSHGFSVHGMDGEE